MIPDAVYEWLSDHQHGDVLKTSPVGGGCINNGSIITTTSGSTFFLKANQRAPADMFAREADGLVALLSVKGAPRLPKPHLYGPDFLLMEDLVPHPKQPGYWTEFGRRLAVLHSHTNPEFGFNNDNYIGSTKQPNPWTGDGWEFFAEHRLLFQARLANQRGLLGVTEVRQVETLAESLPQLVPSQPASLIHGDLWSGNATTDSSGYPAIIDPAAHYGWAEAELAMTTLFGSFPHQFYSAYQEVRPLSQGYEQRFPIYNLYHLLNHVNLFGASYLGQTLSILRRYTN